MRILASVATALLIATIAGAQSVPNGGITQNEVWTVAQWITAWQSKADTNNAALTGTPTVNGVPLSTISSANPSATVGLAAVNGVATTFMTSDSAPPLSQAIVPTWTGVHTFSATPVFNAGETLVNAANAYTQTSTGLSLTSGTTGFGRNITGTVNDASAVDGIVDFANITCTLCTATSYLVDWQVGSTAQFRVTTLGVVTAVGSISSTGGNISPAGGSALVWNGRGILTSPALANVQFGAANASSGILSQTVLTQGALAGTATNTAGGNLTIQSGLGTGTATGSLLILQTPHATTTGTVQQTATTQISMGDNTVAMPNLASSSAATTGTVCWTTGGNLTVDTTLACLASTKRIKQAIAPLDSGLADVMKLRPISYELKPEFDPKHLGRQVGLIAEEVQATDPRLVGLDAAGDVQGVRYMQLTAVLVKAIQEQQKEIEALKKRLR